MIYFSAVISAVQNLPAKELLFSPIKLGVLIAWVYACLYFTQLIEFGNFVEKRNKSRVNALSLAIGPILYVFLLVRQNFGAAAAIPNLNFVDKLKHMLNSAAMNFKGISFTGSRGSASIIILDSSGKSLAEIYSQSGDKQQAKNTLKATEQLIVEAINMRASDILIDPKDHERYAVRYRVGGMLRLVDERPWSECVAIVNSIKAVSSMDIAERRRPQDGAFLARREDENVSFRVASAGVLNGEKLAIRILHQSTGRKGLRDIGVNEKQHAQLAKAVAKPNGMILVCGPTGSGKTTTLYGMLSCIDFLQRNVITVEDPIEYLLPNASQIEVNPKADITFAKALRSILRQDPDVICVGEIRDEETAAIGLQAAQTGHLVLATLHSNSNVSSLIRLLDLKVSPLLLASAISVIVSQRLVRMLCENCKVQMDRNDPRIEFFVKNNLNTSEVHAPKGCEACGNTGYLGRTAIFDVLEMDEALRSNISNGKISVVDLKSVAEKRGMTNLRKEGIRKVLAGITTMDEVTRVTNETGI